MKIPVKHSTMHFIIMAVWVALAYPTIFWWDKSLLWVSIMSWYAIVVTHWWRQVVPPAGKPRKLKKR